MTQTSARTGLIYPDGPDYVSSEPATWKEFDNRLSKSIAITASSLADRKTRVPAPSYSDRYTISIPSLGETHVWDGKNWLIFDDRPKIYTDSDQSSFWYSGSDRSALDVGSGTVEIMVQRKGWKADWSVYMMRASDSNKGGDYWSWYLPYLSNWRRITGSGWTRTSAGETTVTAISPAPNFVCALSPSGRVGPSIITGSGNNEEVFLEGTCRTGSYTP